MCALSAAEKLLRVENKGLLMDGLRRCKCCEEIRPVDHFARNHHRPNARRAVCNECLAEAARVSRAHGRTPHGEKIVEQSALRKQGKSRCRGSCGAVKPLCDFYTSVSRYVSPRCKDCLSAEGRIDSPRARVVRENLRLAPLGQKLCSACRVAKPLEDLVRSNGYCAECATAREVDRRRRMSPEQRRARYDAATRSRRARNLLLGIRQLLLFAAENSIIEQNNHEKEK